MDTLEDEKKGHLRDAGALAEITFCSYLSVVPSTAQPATLQVLSRPFSGLAPGKPASIRICAARALVSSSGQVQ